jgi:hypothetical protein
VLEPREIVGLAVTEQRGLGERIRHKSPGAMRDHLGDAAITSVGCAWPPCRTIGIAGAVRFGAGARAAAFVREQQC